MLSRSRSEAFGGFTLVELLVVMGVMGIMLALLIPAFGSVYGARATTKAVYDIAGAVENARTYAVANNTYTWVGFFEEDGSHPSTTPATAGTGRVVIWMAASADGSTYSTNSSTPPAAFGAGNANNTVTLIPIGKLVKLSNTHLATLLTSGSNVPSRPSVIPAYQVGDSTFARNGTPPATNSTTFTYPLTTGSTASQAQYTFVKIIEFDPQGEPSKIVDGAINGPQSWLEIAISPTHGNQVAPLYPDNGNTAAAALQLEGITGRTDIYLQ